MKRIDAYQHVRNKNVIYRRIDDTNVFMWDIYKRTESNILNEIAHNQKFVPYFENTKNNTMLRKIIQSPFLWVAIFFLLILWISIELNK